MGVKPKYTVEQKVKACEDFLYHHKSATKIANELHMSKSGYTEIYKWARFYKINGKQIFECSDKARIYTTEFKEKVVSEYLAGNVSYVDLASKYNIPGTKTVRKWVKKYNNHIELKDYYPSQEIYIVDTLKASIFI